MTRWPRFQRTYEELKHSLANLAGLGTLFRFQRTYEELKLHYRPPLYMAAPGFQRTYEELKHFFSFSSGR